MAQMNWEEAMNWTKEITAGVGFLVFVASTYLFIGQIAA
jgi:hypothetical protein